jgi:hypothetical protein
MRLFSFGIWLLWAAIVARVLLAPWWGMTLGQGMVLLLVAAPAVGVLLWIAALFRRVGRSTPPAASSSG